MQQSCEKIRLNAQWLQKEAQNVLQYLKENPPSAKPSGGDNQSNCFCLKVMFLAKGTVSLFTCLFLFKGDVSSKGDSQSVYLSVSVSV